MYSRSSALPASPGVRPRSASQTPSNDAVRTIFRDWAWLNPSPRSGEASTSRYGPIGPASICSRGYFIFDELIEHVLSSDPGRVVEKSVRSAFGLVETLDRAALF